jgi:hypothetical protein
MTLQKMWIFKLIGICEHADMPENQCCEEECIIEQRTENVNVNMTDSGMSSNSDSKSDECEGGMSRVEGLEEYYC